MPMIATIHTRADLIRFVGVVLSSVLLAVLFGAVAGTGSILISALLIAVIVGVILIAYPFVLTASALVTSLVVVGTAESFFSFGQANWIASLMVGCLLLATFFSKPKAGKVETGLSRSWSRTLLFAALWCYFGCMLISTLINFVPAAQLTVGIRNYIPFIGLFFILAFGRLDDQRIKALIWGLVAVGCVQWLYCVAEQLYIVPRRTASLAAIGGGAEAIVGSFGGNPLAGGYTGEMAAFLVMILLLCGVLWQAKILPRWVFLLSCLSAGVSVGLAETKIVLILVPLMLLVILWRWPGGLSLKVVKLVAVGVLGIVLVTSVYAYRYWSDSSEVFHAFTYSFETKFMVDSHHRGRVAGITYWGDQAVSKIPLPQVLFGFGPSASVEASFLAGEGAAVRQFGLGLDNTAISKLLWDFGLFGTLSFCLLIVGAFFEAARLSRSTWVAPWAAWVLVAFKGWMLAFAVMLPYQVSMIGGAPMQFLFWFTAGVIAYFGAWRTNDAATIAASAKGEF